MRKLLLIPMLLLPLTLHAEGVTRDMADGSVVRIDPASRTATLFSHDGTTQLWDGVHETSDGTVIIVRDGVVVTGGQALPEAPQEEKPAAQQGMGSTGTPAATTAAEPDSTCVNLVIKACGFDGECASSPGCSPARQLLALQSEETMRAGGAAIAEVSGHCREAMTNEALFPPCTKTPAAAKASACQRLREKVCGTKNQCGDGPACGPSRQLVDMEGQERQSQIRRPERQIKLSRQCEKLLEGDAFFTPCTK